MRRRAGDMFLTDPRRCKVGPEVLAEAGLSQTQIEAMLKVYSGPVNPRTGERIFHGLMPGTEGDVLLIRQQDPEWVANQTYVFKWAFGPDFDYKTFDFDKDTDFVDRKLASAVNAVSADLSAFRENNGKLIILQGTADSAVSMYDNISYYEEVVERAGGLEAAQKFARFFIIPGMAHLLGGPGLQDVGQCVSSKEVPQDTEHNVLTAMMEWVENGRVPESLIATGYDSVHPISGEGTGVRFQRPVYPYPLFSEYIGGDVNDPNSYRGTAHERGADLV